MGIGTVTVITVMGINNRGYMGLEQNGNGNHNGHNIELPEELSPWADILQCPLRAAHLLDYIKRGVQIDHIEELPRGGIRFLENGMVHILYDEVLRGSESDTNPFGSIMVGFIAWAGNKLA